MKNAGVDAAYLPLVLSTNLAFVQAAAQNNLAVQAGGARHRLRPGRCSTNRRRRPSGPKSSSPRVGAGRAEKRGNQAVPVRPDEVHGLPRRARLRRLHRLPHRRPADQGARGRRARTPPAHGLRHGDQGLGTWDARRPQLSAGRRRARKASARPRRRRAAGSCRSRTGSSCRTRTRTRSRGSSSRRASTGRREPRHPHHRGRDVGDGDRNRTRVQGCAVPLSSTVSNASRHASWLAATGYLLRDRHGTAERVA